MFRPENDMESRLFSTQKRPQITDFNSKYDITRKYKLKYPPTVCAWSKSVCTLASSPKNSSAGIFLGSKTNQSAICLKLFSACVVAADNLSHLSVAGPMNSSVILTPNLVSATVGLFKNFDNASTSLPSLLVRAVVSDNETLLAFLASDNVFSVCWNVPLLLSAESWR